MDTYNNNNRPLTSVLQLSYLRALKILGFVLLSPLCGAWIYSACLSTHGSVIKDIQSHLDQIVVRPNF